MANIFDLGRPTGAMAGVSVAETDRRTNRDSDLSYQSKRAEFLDYVMDAELRGTARQAGIAKNKAITKTAPSGADAQVSQNEQALQQSEADKTLIEPKRKANLQQVHTAMTDQEYNDVTRAYYALTESVAAGRPPSEAYVQARAEIIRAGARPEQVAKWLADQGITEEFSESAFNSLMGLANYGLHDAKHARQKNLLEVEWDMRRRVEIAKALADKDAPKVWTPDAEDSKSVGSILSQAVTGFGSLQGSVNDDGSYSDAKGSMVNTVTRWSYDRATRGAANDPYIVPTDYQMIGADLLNFAEKQVTKEGTMWGWTHGGNDFDPIAFTNVAELATQAVENYRLKLGPNAPSAYMTWQQIRGPVLQQLTNSHQKVDDVASVTPKPGAPVNPPSYKDMDPITSSFKQKQKATPISKLITDQFKKTYGTNTDATP